MKAGGVGDRLPPPRLGADRRVWLVLSRRGVLVAERDGRLVVNRDRLRKRRPLVGVKATAVARVPAGVDVEGQQVGQPAPVCLAPVA